MMPKTLLAISATLLLCATALSVTNAKSSSLSCQDCRSTVSYFKSFQQSEDKDYREIFTNFCQIYYPNSTDFRHGPCGMIIPTVFHVLDNMDVVHHCDQIGACTIGPGLLQQEPASKHVKGVMCDVCVSTVDSLRQQLSDPKTLDQVELLLDQLCEYLKVVNAAGECKEQVPKILDYLKNFAQSVDPRSYCESIKFCQPEVSRVAIKKISGPAVENLNLLSLMNYGPQVSYQVYSKSKIESSGVNPKHHKGPECAFCKFVFSQLMNFLEKNTTRSNIEKNLTKVCGAIFMHEQPHRQQCEELVNKYSDRIFEILLEETDPNMICILLGECVFKPDPSPINILSEQSASRKEVDDFGGLLVMLDSSLVDGSMEVCVECKLFIKFLQEQMKDEKSEERLKNALKKQLCDKLPTETKESCYSIIDKYATAFFEAVSQSLDPTTTCISLGACKQKALSEATICDKCVETITKIDEYVSKNDIHNNVTNIIENVCKKLDSSLVNVCTEIMQTFGGELISVISSMDNPKQVCSSIFLC